MYSSADCPGMAAQRSSAPGGSMDLVLKLESAGNSAVSWFVVYVKVEPL